MAAATAGADGKRREADGRVPSLRREGAGFVIARPVRRLVVAIRIPRPPSPFSMFSNGNLKTPQFFIFHFASGRVRGRAMLAPTGGCRREARGVEDAAPYGGCGRGGRPMAAATGGCGVHVAANGRRYGRARAGGGGQWPPLRAAADGAGGGAFLLLSSPSSAG